LDARTVHLVEPTTTGKSHKTEVLALATND
jgi:hypothetical protein